MIPEECLHKICPQCGGRGRHDQDLVLVRQVLTQEGHIEYYCHTCAHSWPVEPDPEQTAKILDVRPQ